MSAEPPATDSGERCRWALLIVVPGLDSAREPLGGARRRLGIEAVPGEERERPLTADPGFGDPLESGAPTLEESGSRPLVGPDGRLIALAAAGALGRLGTFPEHILDELAFDAETGELASERPLAPRVGAVA